MSLGLDLNTLGSNMIAKHMRMLGRMPSTLMHLMHGCSPTEMHHASMQGAWAQARVYVLDAWAQILYPSHAFKEMSLDNHAQVYVSWMFF